MSGTAERVLLWSGVSAAALSAHAALNARLLRRPVSSPVDQGRPRDMISVLVPARNEALRIGPTIASVLRQRGVELELVVLDDGSTDGTADAVRRAAEGDPRVRIVEGRPLPAGWLGKPYACMQLSEAAAGRVLAFIDADVELQPDALAAAVQLMEAHGLSMVSPYPRQVAGTLPERVVQPLLQWLLLTFLPLRLAEGLRPVSMAAANGQFLVVDAAAYRHAGGHHAVRDRVVEDVWLARAFKAAGHRAVVVDGTHLASCRMYADWSELRDGYSKNLWAAFGSPVAAAGVAAVFGFVYVAPAGAALAGLATGRRSLARAGLVGYVAGVVGRIISARTTGGRVADAWMHPASISVLIMLLARSWWMKLSGRLRWSGRPVVVSGG